MLLACLLACFLSFFLACLLACLLARGIGKRTKKTIQREISSLHNIAANPKYTRDGKTAHELSGEIPNPFKVLELFN